MDEALKTVYDSEFKFLNEMPAKQTTEVTDKLLEIIGKAQKKIRIIQPYI